MTSVEQFISEQTRRRFSSALWGWITGTVRLLGDISKDMTSRDWTDRRFSRALSG